MLEYFNLHITLALFLILLLVISFAILIVNDFIELALLTGLFSLFSVIIFIILDAVDVAMTEAAVGSVVSTALLLVLVYLTKQYAPTKKVKLKFNLVSIFSGIFCILLFIILVFSVYYAPAFGYSKNPAHLHEIYKVYTKDSFDVFGISNAVTMILGSFRGYDTLGESTVVFLASLGVYFILDSVNYKKKNYQKTITYNLNHTDNNKYVIPATLYILCPLIILYAFYVQFHGDYSPGGGFQAGVLLSAAILLMILYYPLNVSNKICTDKKFLLISTLGVMIYLFTGYLTMLLHSKFLDYYVLSKDTHSAYNYGLFSVELGVLLTVFAGISVIMSKFYSLITTTRD